MSMFLTCLYLVSAGAMAIYGLHRLWLATRLVLDRRVRQALEPARQFVELPFVTVQLPMFNEPQVAERVITAACALDYPRERLHIQVLDDSNDESTARTRACCERLARDGHSIVYLRRAVRSGFKSGALAAGLTATTSEFIALFDADFVPPPRFLREIIHHFTDSRVGVVQAEWSHLNRSTSWLTELQAIFLDGHFVVEQAVRSRSNRWFNFNGTAGVWRRACIDEAGGWQHDTLTEDTDLSYRAQLAGWRFLYLPTLHCAAELPSSMSAFVEQQHRWTKGLIQTAMKLLPRIVRSRAPLKVKLEAWLHLTSPLLYVVMLGLSAIALPAMFVVTPFTEEPKMAWASIGTFSLGALGAATFYLVSQRAQGRSVTSTLLRIPSLMALGIGICAVNSRAVFEALTGQRSDFVRTPKVGNARSTPVAQTVGSPNGFFELLLAGVLCACFWLTFRRPFTLIGAPFLILSAIGYSTVGVLRLFEPLAVTDRTWSRVAATACACIALTAGAMTTVRLAQMNEPPAPMPRRIAEAARQSELVQLDVKLLDSAWEIARNGPRGAIRSLTTDHTAWTLNVALNEADSEGEISLNLDLAAAGLQMPVESLFLGSWYRATFDVPDRQLVFQVEVPPQFVGELQAFVKDAEGRSEYGAMQVLLGSGNSGLVTVMVTPSSRTPAMGYRDEGFNPSSIREVGLKVSAQSDRARGPDYRPFTGALRVIRVGIADVAAQQAPEMREPNAELHALSVRTPAEFSRNSGVDRPWPLGYAFAGPLNDDGIAELDRTYAAIAAEGHHFTRVYVGDYRAGLRFDAEGLVSGLEPDFLNYFKQLATIANRHGVTVMLSLTDNAMVNPGDPMKLAFIRPGPNSDAFVANAVVELIATLKDRDIIWDVFNEPENVTALPLRTVQAYVDRVLLAARRGAPNARFTVVSRSRAELAYWRGRGLNLLCHNIFTERSMAEALAAARELEVPVFVAEIAPALLSSSAVEALRQAGYDGVGLWGWGTLDRFQLDERALFQRAGALQGLH